MRIFLIVLISCLSSAAFADNSTLLEAMNKFHRLTSDETLRQQAYEAGQERIRFCGYCHGEDGNSKRDYIPNLASQNPVYLFRQFEKFANGERKDYVMSELAKVLTQEDRINIAIYYSQQKVQPKASANAALEKEGEQLYNRVCFSCHGRSGEGMEEMPRLAGQPESYIKHSLNLFRNNDPSRANSPMMGIAAMLSDKDINAVAAYLQQLK